MDGWLKHLENTVNKAAIDLSSISEDVAARPSQPGKWSPKQIIGHLIDSAANNHQRFVRAQFSDDLVFPGYEQEAWVGVQQYNDAPWLQLIQLWQQYNLHLCRVMSLIPNEVRQKVRMRHNLNEIAWKTVSTDKPVTLDYFMQDYAGHLQHHLHQILGDM